jgi:hypothetical protein
MFITRYAQPGVDDKVVPVLLMNERDFIVVGYSKDITKSTYKEIEYWWDPEKGYFEYGIAGRWHKAVIVFRGTSKFEICAIPMCYVWQRLAAFQNSKYT